MLEKREKSSKQQQNRVSRSVLKDNNLLNTNSAFFKLDISAASKLLSLQIETLSHDSYQCQYTLSSQSECLSRL